MRDPGPGKEAQPIVRGSFVRLDACLIVSYEYVYEQVPLLPALNESESVDIYTGECWANSRNTSA